MSGVVRIEIRETPEELKTLMRKEKDVLRYEKLQILYWLKTQTVDSVLSAAVQLGKHRTTIQRWLSSYRSGGIGELLSSEASLRQTQNYDGPNCRETRKRIERTRRIQ
jgi:transposase